MNIEPPKDLTLQRYIYPDLTDVTWSTIVSLWESTYGGVMREDPFFTTERFLQRMHGYAAAPGFSMAVGYCASRPVGMACGYALPPRARWWADLVTEVPEGFTEETGSRTFAINEIIVHPNFPGRRYATILHDFLLESRTEERATLLVEQDNVARNIYIGWGWRRAGKLKPFDDSPTFDVMILPLPRSGASRL
jgi:ribosomal protein S18 acetylase RimI-like enzyme